VLDPFFGNRHHRRSSNPRPPCIGIERDSNYARLAREHIAAVEIAPAEMVTTPAKRDAAGASRSALCGARLAEPGASVDAAGLQPRVRADGTVISAASRGSDSPVGAEVQARPAQRLGVLAFPAQGQPVVDRLLRHRCEGDVSAGEARQPRQPIVFSRRTGFRRQHASRIQGRE